MKLNHRHADLGRKHRSLGLKNQLFAELAPLSGHITAHSWHTQSEFGTVAAQYRLRVNHSLHTENYSSHYSMIEIVQSAAFESWFSGLKDIQARARIMTRIRRLSLGNAGDVKPVGAGVSEMRIDYGPRLPCVFPAARQSSCCVQATNEYSKKTFDRHWTLPRHGRVEKWPQSEARR